MEGWDLFRKRVGSIYGLQHIGSLESIARRLGFWWMDDTGTCVGLKRTHGLDDRTGKIGSNADGVYIHM